MTVRRRPEPSERVQQICRDTVLADARRWYRSDFPRIWVMSLDLLRRLEPDARLVHETFQRYISETFDASLKWGYERLYAKYGGAVADLPWSGTDDRRTE